jgi:hypothetical protein
VVNADIEDHRGAKVVEAAKTAPSPKPRKRTQPPPGRPQ